MNNEVKVSVLMKTKTMYEFLLLHAYKGISGIISVLFSLSMLIYLVMKYQDMTKGKMIVIGLGALLFTVINPLVLYFNATKQVKMNPMFKKPIVYVLNEQGITVEQEEQSATMSWDEVQKVVETRQSIIIYLSRARAYILPKVDLSEQCNKLKELVNTQIESNRCKWNKR